MELKPVDRERLREVLGRVRTYNIQALLMPSPEHLASYKDEAVKALPWLVRAAEELLAASPIHAPAEQTAPAEGDGDWRSWPRADVGDGKPKSVLL